MSIISGPVSETSRLLESFGDMLREKKVLVTGASRGIGRAAAIALAQAGADVAVNYQSAYDAAKEVCTEVRRRGVRSRLYQANVSCEKEAQDMVAKVVDDFGPIDILVNNAGITRDKSFLKMTRTMWDEVLGVNLNGAVQHHPGGAAGHGGEPAGGGSSTCPRSWARRATSARPTTP